MILFEYTRSFLNRLGSNLVTPTAYDTAWLATLRGTDSDMQPRFPECLSWINMHQHTDGSWGGEIPYYHDRLISTLRAVLTLHNWGRRSEDRRRIQAGISYIWRNAERRQHDAWETIGFEMIFPTLLSEAQQQGIDLPYHAFEDVRRLREQKLALAPLSLIYRRDLPMMTNLESLGPLLDIEQARETQDVLGAVGICSSATAYLLQHWPDNKPAYNYLRNVLAKGMHEGGASPFFPLETFERGWALHWLQHGSPDTFTQLITEARPSLDYLYATRQPTGWAASQYTPVKESDSTGVCYSVLGYAGYDLDPQMLYHYEEATHFRCYPFERNPSLSANAHVLDALRYCDSKERAPRVEKLIRFFQQWRLPGGYWFDKWHISPYYITALVVLAAHDVAPDLVSPAIDWLQQTEWRTGGWGYLTPTMEETAYALLALLAWQRDGHELRDGIVERGATYLRQHFLPASLTYPSLWIHKALYTPVQVVQGAVLAAMLGTEASV